MGAAAELHRYAGHINHPHHIGIFLAEHRHSTSRLGLLDRHLLHLEAVGLSNPAVDQRFDLSQLLRGDRRRAMEIEAQPVEIHQGARLTDARIHHLLQGSLQEVSGGVIGLGPPAARAIHLGIDGVTQGQLTPFDPS